MLELLMSGIVREGSRRGIRAKKGFSLLVLSSAMVLRFHPLYTVARPTVLLDGSCSTGGPETGGEELCAL